MSGSRFVYILVLILFLFAGGGYAIGNWDDLKSQLPDQLVSFTESMSRKAAPTYEKVKTGLNTLLYGGKDRIAGPAIAPVRATGKIIEAPAEAAPAAGKQTTSSTVPAPRFGNMRLAREGGSVFSGTAEPGARVTVEANGRRLGRTKANRKGDWVLIIDEPMREKKYRFGLMAQGPGRGDKKERGADASITFAPEDGGNKIVSFSKSGIATVATRQAPVVNPGSSSDKKALDKKQVLEKKLAQAKKIALAKKQAAEKKLAQAKKIALAKKQALEKKLAQAKKIALAKKQAAEEKLAQAKKIALAKKQALEKKLAQAKKIALAKKQALEKKLAEAKKAALAKKAAHDKKLALAKKRVLEKIEAAEKKPAQAAKKTGSGSDAAQSASPSVTDGLFKKASELADAASKKFSQVLGDLKSDGEVPSAIGSGKVVTDVKPAAKKPTARKKLAALSFDKVTIKNAAAGGSSQLTLSGRAEPGANIGIYLGRRALGSVKADASGGWFFKGNRNIPFGKNRLRAQHEGAGGKVMGRAEYSVVRAKPKTIVALKNPTPLVSGGKKSSAVKKPVRVAARSSRRKTASSRRPASRHARYKKRAGYKKRAAYKKRTGYKKRASYKRAKKRHRRVRVAGYRKYRDERRWAFNFGHSWGSSRPTRKYRQRKSSRTRCGRGYNCYRVRRGDTLWKISKRRYGTGKLYRRIFKANRKRIKNPNLIYTRQVICIEK